MVLAEMDQAAAKTTSALFASAERAAPQDIGRQSQLIAGQKLLGVLPDVVPCMLMVINTHRQIVFANKRLLDLLPPEQRQAGVLGRRPGEVLGCVHAFETDEGCGTTESCTFCGAVNAMLSGLHGSARVEECRITRANGDALDLRVWTTPLALDGEPFTVFAALDISHEKRRQALERIFLHDIGNVASGLKWYTELLERGTPDKSREFQAALGQLSRELLDEIDGQRTLVRAESGELVLTPERLGTRQLLQEAVELYRRHPVSHERHLRIDPDAEDIAVTSDRMLLSRVLGNLIKNALEACRAGQTVTVGCSPRPGEGIELWVHNPGAMPRAVQLQVFQRSFSTKGTGRGLGTYSIKLLTERYLHGHVSFTSTPEQGTTFKVHYPLVPNA
ncbi:MAG: HAMP domain-containing histidine kinase [Planctomycetes bacterium]|nr:HAMP domain-containing histidine kinase [Planctomycetota bacterium]